MTFESTAAEEPRSTLRAMWNGWGKRCPRCGNGAAFGRFLKVNAQCPRCGLELHHQRADDAPPYFTILVVGHVVVPLMLMLERSAAPPEWMHLALWLPLTLVLCLWLLPRIKGALIGFQWAKAMHGFGGDPD